MTLDARLAELIPNLPETLFQAARYALLSPGKRFRARLTLSCCKSFGAPESLALDPACALEIVHTYSLIHDDLPCMDNDDFRRGQPSLHKVYGDAIALLTGDFLLTYAFEILGQVPTFSAEQKLSLVQTLAKAAGAQGMLGGQVLDMESTGRRIGAEALLTMHRGKTAALFSAALQFGRIAADAPPSFSSALQALGDDVGLAFQFLDDLQDEDDLAKEKPNALALFGKEGTLQRLLELKHSIERALQKLPSQGAPIALLLKETLWMQF